MEPGFGEFYCEQCGGSGRQRAGRGGCIVGVARGQDEAPEEVRGEVQRDGAPRGDFRGRSERAVVVRFGPKTRAADLGVGRRARLVGVGGGRGRQRAVLGFSHF